LKSNKTSGGLFIVLSDLLIYRWQILIKSFLRTHVVRDTLKALTGG
jgi:hypothetical protein